MANFFNVAAKHVSRVQNVVRAVDNARRSVLYKSGGMLRTVAARSMRRVGKNPTPYSKPGTPPRARTGGIRNPMAFKVLPDDSVIVGPPLSASKGNAARLQEVGGTIRGKRTRVPIPTKSVRKNVRWEKGEEPRPSKKIPGHMFVLVDATRNYEPRPYMGPALQKVSKKYPKLFTDSVKP